MFFKHVVSKWNLLFIVSFLFFCVWNWIITGPLSPSPLVSSISTATKVFILFIICWFGGLYCLDNILFHGVNFCCCWYRYQYVQNWILTGPLPPSPPPPHVSSSSSATQWYIFFSLFVGATVSIAFLFHGQKSIVVVVVVGIGINIFKIGLSMVPCLCLHLLLYHQVQQKHKGLYFFIICWCGNIFCLDNILFNGVNCCCYIGTGIDIFKIRLSLLLSLCLHLLL